MGHEQRRPGSIPACAGEPSRRTPRRGARRVDPRVCGGARERSPDAGEGHGRSPRVRGSLVAARLRDHVMGSIPAGAGEPPSCVRNTISARVDPRVCGGAAVAPDLQRPAGGRSPRVRGSHPRWSRGPAPRGSIPACAGSRALRHLPNGRVGSIPACAGEPGCASCGARTRRVDPRVCGGAATIAANLCPSSGRSPRVRGSRAAIRASRGRRGSIPACAGEPCSSSGNGCPSRVDPRVCGGASPARPMSASARGRSPRVRGSLAAHGSDDGCDGSIPACAGEPSTSARVVVTAGVDPRVCGGAYVVKTGGLFPQGRSPRVRGSHARRVAQRHGLGSIPACAGEPEMKP